MGCSGPKSLIPVRDGKNFIDLTVQQITVNLKISLYPSFIGKSVKPSLDEFE